MRGRAAWRRQRQVLVATLLVSDGLMVGLALLLAWYLRIGSGLLPYGAPGDLPLYLQTTLVAVPLMLILFAFAGLYRYNLLLGGPQEYGNVFRACTYGIVALVFVSFLQRTTSLSRSWLLIAWLLSTLLVGSSRFLWRRVFHWLRRAHDWLTTPTLIVGADEHSRAIAHQLAGDRAGIQIVGFVDDFLPVGTPVLDDLVVLGVPRQVHELASRHQVEQVILVPNAVAWETFQEIVEQAGEVNGYELQLSPGFYEILTANVEVTHRAFVPLLRVQPARIVGIDLLLKTILDYGLGAVLALLTLPLALLVGLAIWLSDGRPVLERHQVLGMQGKPFYTRKFRTDLLGAVRRRLDAVVPQEVVNNPQVSWRLGQVLYRTGLDKLPQLWDVLAGHMSLVGPRTMSASPDQAYRHWLPNLLTVKPGWTGPWAVDETEMLEEEMRLAVYYVRNWTIWLDLQILFQSGKKLLVRGGLRAGAADGREEGKEGG
jgi:lipopolysaccharide/colanic/teichoic acid biosynthesis glycosyltransferase